MEKLLIKSGNEKHFPVLKEEVLKWINLEDGGLYVDCTCGAGGHSKFLLSSGKNIFLICIDKDEKMLKIAEENLKEFKNYKLIKGGFENIDKILEKEGIDKVDGFLFDLGFSLLQVRDPERGFSFQIEGPLDMRYDRSSNLTAFDIINKWQRKDLIYIFKNYGEIENCEKIVDKIIERRKRKKFETTTELSEFISQNFKERKRIHPATRFFLALRIKVNNELDCLKIGLEKTVDFLKNKGRILVISFNSLEDRIVKNFFKLKKELKILTKKPLVPSEQEIKENPLSRSAKLRVGEKDEEEKKEWK
ncbi:MAG: 16S rRNA (cytosine(1402)-N(4))-methyltransferase RsmH [Candidatus Omnitrophica bacterium]|nr:16S rRNA (cytosine(1402)-N(4))-methyltransferase RsmH [Candidatus Omnitrophota bacterium]MCM8810358.1 16S rRNA (cytosine(1402)-N(4))-methyltransferase RsmH [Candidatus Omnitrophota bacterium]